jgi:hypothetical protein
MARINSIKVSEFKKLRDNYKSGLAAGETTSCFIYIRELIELMQQRKDLKKLFPYSPAELSAFDYAPIRIYFVREDLSADEKSLKLYEKRHIQNLKHYSIANGKFSQIIPVVVLAENGEEKGPNILDKTGEYIKVLRPGGEGTGICPPPPGDNEG